MILELHPRVIGHHEEHLYADEEGWKRLEYALRARDVDARSFDPVTYLGVSALVGLPVYLATEDREPCPCYVRWPRR